MRQKKKTKTDRHSNRIFNRARTNERVTKTPHWISLYSHFWPIWIRVEILHVGTFTNEPNVSRIPKTKYLCVWKVITDTQSQQHHQHHHNHNHHHQQQQQKRQHYINSHRQLISIWIELVSCFVFFFSLVSLMAMNEVRKYVCMVHERFMHTFSTHGNVLI